MNRLPDNFDEYEEAKREGFLKVKEFRDKGVKVVVNLCTYTPVEIIDAAGAVPVSLCGKDNSSVADAEMHLPQNLCPLIKSSYGYAITDKCPYFYFSDLIVGETTCDGKKKMYEILNDVKQTHVMHLPQGQEKEHALEYWKKELLVLIDVLEEKFNVEITKDKLSEAIKERNEERKVLVDFYSLGKLNPSPISGYEINTVMEAIGFEFDKKKMRQDIAKRTEELKDKYEREYKGKKSTRPRIVITGCPSNGVREKVLKQIEDLGADIVCFENCSGPKEKMELVNETIDPIDALAQKYLNVNCSVM